MRTLFLLFVVLIDSIAALGVSGAAMLAALPMSVVNCFVICCFATYLFYARIEDAAICHLSCLRFRNASYFLAIAWCWQVTF
ncbi:MAG: hypothetical protein V4805_07185 [Pseudomonadota bacterium]